MYTGTCHTGTLGSAGSLGTGDWIGLILNLVLLVGLLAGLALLAVYVLRRTQAPAAGAQLAGLPTAGENLQAQYARGEITREQYERKKQDIE